MGLLDNYNAFVVSDSMMVTCQATGNQPSKCADLKYEWHCVFNPVPLYGLSFLLHTKPPCLLFREFANEKVKQLVAHASRFCSLRQS